MKKEINRIRVTAALLATLVLGSTAGCAKKEPTNVGTKSNTSTSSTFDVSVAKNYTITLGMRELVLSEEQYNELVAEVIKNEKYYNRDAIIEDGDHVQVERYYTLNIFGENITLNEKDYEILVNQLLKQEIINIVDESKDKTNEDTTSLVDTYEPLTTERFNKLVKEIKESFEKINLAVKDEDVRKFAMILNIDTLAEDNKELISEIIGEQDPTEVFADADKVIDTIMTYHYEYYYSDDDAIIKAFEAGVAYKHDIDGFVKLSDFIYDKDQKEIVLEIEKRIAEINDSVRDNEKMNELVYKLLKDMIGATSKLSLLEDGTNYAVEWLYIELIRGMFGMDLNGHTTLNPTNDDLVKYYVSYVDDEQKYVDNASVNGSTRNINDLLNDCKAKTLTK